MMERLWSNYDNRYKLCNDGELWNNNEKLEKWNKVVKDKR